MTHDRADVPWWRIATAALLSVALALTAAAGRVAEAIIVAVLLVITLGILCLWLIDRRRGSPSLPRR